MSPQELVGKTVSFQFMSAHVDTGRCVAFIPKSEDAQCALSPLRIKHGSANRYNHTSDRLCVLIPQPNGFTGLAHQPKVRLVPFVEGRFTVVEETTCAKRS